MKFKKIMALVTAMALSFSVPAFAGEASSLNMDTVHPDRMEMSYVSSKYEDILPDGTYKKEEVVYHTMIYRPDVLSVRRTKTSAYIDVDVYDCSMFTTVQISTSRTNFANAKTVTFTNNKYQGPVLSEYIRVEDYLNKRITFTRNLVRFNYGRHNYSYRKIDITKNPSQKLITTEPVANSIKHKISCRKTLRITGLDPRKRYYFRLKSIYKGFGDTNIKYPRRVSSLTTTVTAAPPIK